MSNALFRKQYRDILGMKVNTDNIGGDHDMEDEIKVCGNCGAVIDDEWAIPIFEGKYLCDDCDDED